MDICCTLPSCHRIFTPQALHQELSYASYLNIQVAILPPPRNRKHIAAYARAINSCLNTVPYIQISVLIPIYDPSVFQHSPLPTRLFAQGSSSSPSSYAQPSIATWEMWDTVRTICDYNPRLSIGEDVCCVPSTMTLTSC